MPPSSLADSLEILLVEDNPGDVRLTQEAFRSTEFDTTLHSVSNGAKALDFLTERRDDPDDTVPDLILLDLNMPRMDGFDVLEELKEDPVLSSLPVLILTSSKADDDIAESYELCANAYLTKPDGPDEFVSLARTIESFWVDTAQLPPVPAL